MTKTIKEAGNPFFSGDNGTDFRYNRERLYDKEFE